MKQNQDKLADFLMKNAPVAPPPASTSESSEDQILRILSSSNESSTASSRWIAAFSLAAVLALGLFVSLNEKPNRTAHDPTTNGITTAETASEILVAALVDFHSEDETDDVDSNELTVDDLYLDWTLLASAASANH